MTSQKKASPPKTSNKCRYRIFVPGQIATLGCKCVCAWCFWTFIYFPEILKVVILTQQLALVKAIPGNHQPAGHLIVLRPLRFDFLGFSIRKPIHQPQGSATWGWFRFLTILQISLLSLIRDYPGWTAASYWTCFWESWKKRRRDRMPNGSCKKRNCTVKRGSAVVAGLFENCFIFILACLGWCRFSKDSHITSSSFKLSRACKGNALPASATWYFLTTWAFEGDFSNSKRCATTLDCKLWQSAASPIRERPLCSLEIRTLQ